MQKIIIVSVLVLQTILISIILVHVFKSKKDVLGSAVKLIALQNQNFPISSSGKLKYFYEPKADRKILDSFTSPKTEITINLDTLNERYDYSVDKPSDVFRIITLGDSITYGFHVSTKDNWTELLEDKLNSEMRCLNIKKFEVINLAVPGYDNEYSVERYKIRGQNYKPDLIIWYQFDMMRISEEVKKLQVNYLSNATHTKQETTSNPVDTYNALWISAMKSAKEKLGENGILDIQEKSIDSLKDYYNRKLIFVVFPKMPQLWDNLLKKIVSKDKNYYLLNTHDYIQEGGAVDRVHPNQKGHQMIAEDIFKYMSSNKLIPCK